MFHFDSVVSLGVESDNQAFFFILFFHSFFFILLFHSFFWLSSRNFFKGGKIYCANFYCYAIVFGPNFREGQKFSGGNCLRGGAPCPPLLWKKARVNVVKFGYTCAELYEQLQLTQTPLNNMNKRMMKYSVKAICGSSRGKQDGNSLLIILLQSFF